MKEGKRQRTLRKDGKEGGKEGRKKGEGKEKQKTKYMKEKEKYNLEGRREERALKEVRK